MRCGFPPTGPAGSQLPPTLRPAGSPKLQLALLVGRPSRIEHPTFRPGGPDGLQSHAVLAAVVPRRHQVIRDASRFFARLPAPSLSLWLWLPLLLFPRVQWRPGLLPVGCQWRRLEAPSRPPRHQTPHRRQPQARRKWDRIRSRDNSNRERMPKTATSDAQNGGLPQI